MQLTQAALDAMLSLLIDADGTFEAGGVFIGVFAGINDVGLATVIGDITPPPTTVAVRQEVDAYSTPYSMLDGRRVADGPLMQFRPGSSADATTVIGWYAADSITAGNLLGFGYFDGPVALPDENSAVNVIFRITVDPTGSWSAEQVFNG